MIIVKHLYFFEQTIPLLKLIFGVFILGADVKDLRNLRSWFDNFRNLRSD